MLTGRAGCGLRGLVQLSKAHARRVVPFRAARAKASAPSNPLRVAPEDIAPAVPAVLGVGTGYFLHQALYTVVKLGVPNILGADELSASEIARQLPGTPNVELLDRCMRLLSAATPLFEEGLGAGGAAVYKLSTAGALLQTGVDGQPSFACGVQHWLERPLWNAWAELPAHVAGEKDGVPFGNLHGMPVFDYYAQHPESANPFHEFMSVLSGSAIPVVTEMFDWTPYHGKTVVDVGGGYGTVAAAIKARHPSINAVSFDQPEVVEAAGAPPAGVTFAAGNFFEAGSIPETDGAVFMKHILHDWDDAACAKILAACRVALLPGAKVIVADMVVPEAGEADPTKAVCANIDVLMAVICGGKERTRGQWDALAAASGFAVEGLMRSPVPGCQILTLAPI